MPDKKVLIITYYWPPAGGISVQRWVKFVKFLRGHGWEPVIYTVSNGEYSILDESRKKDLPADLTVIRQPIWEPYQLYKTFSGKLTLKNDMFDLRNCMFLIKHRTCFAYMDVETFRIELNRKSFEQVFDFFPLWSWGRRNG